MTRSLVNDPARCFGAAGDGVAELEDVEDDGETTFLKIRTGKDVSSATSTASGPLSV